MEVPLWIGAPLLLFLFWRMYHLLKTLNGDRRGHRHQWLFALDGAALGFCGGVLAGSPLIQAVVWGGMGAFVLYVSGSFFIESEETGTEDDAR